MTQSGSTKAPEKRSSSSKRATPRKSSTGKRGGTTRKAAPAAQDKRTRKTATVNLPFVTAEFRMPDMHVPHPSLESVPGVNRLPRPHVPEGAGRQLTDAGRVVGSYLPERKEVALFAGLAVATVAGALEWPVAVAVAAGTEVARRAARSAQESPAPRQRPAAANAS